MSFPSSKKPPIKVAGIPSALYHRLCQVLPDCGKFFDDDQQLKAVFTNERIAPWRQDVPQSSDSVSRVHALINFLYPKRRSDTQENALVLFLRVLSGEIDSGDANHKQLADLASELEQSINKNVL